MEILAGKAVLLAVNLDYFGSIAATAFFIVSYGKIHDFMYFCLGIGILLTVFFTSCIYSKILGGVDMMERMMREKRILARFKNVKTRTRKTRIIWSWLVAMKIIDVRYGPFTVLNRDFVIKYFANLVANVTDSVLMLDLA